MTDEKTNELLRQMIDDLRYYMEMSESIVKTVYGPPPFGQKNSLSTDDLLVEIGHLVHINNRLLGIIATQWMIGKTAQDDNENSLG